MMPPKEKWLLRSGDKDKPGSPSHCTGAQFLLSGHNILGRSWYLGTIDGQFGPASAEAARQAKFDLGYADTNVTPTFGPALRDYLTGKRKRTPAMLLRAKTRRRRYVWPTSPRGTIIGTPGVGTHSFIVPPNNWESDNAWDISVPLGSKVIAVADGVIGPQFGPLPDPDPRFHGIRLHLVTPENEFYYAHLSKTTPGLGPGDTVKQGEILALSGSGNGVPHLHIAVKRLIRLEDL